MKEEMKGIKEIKLTDFSPVNQLDLSGGFVCDVETGVCGPIDEGTEKEKIEENENEDNNLV